MSFVSRGVSLAMHSNFVLVLNFAKLLIQLILLTGENKSIIIQPDVNVIRPPPSSLHSSADQQLTLIDCSP